eukprot:6336871-Amphidinium_carterae.1
MLRARRSASGRGQNRGERGWNQAHRKGAGPLTELSCCRLVIELTQASQWYFVEKTPLRTQVVLLWCFAHDVAAKTIGAMTGLKHHAQYRMVYQWKQVISPITHVTCFSSQPYLVLCRSGHQPPLHQEAGANCVGRIQRVLLEHSVGDGRRSLWHIQPRQLSTRRRSQTIFSNLSCALGKRIEWFYPQQDCFEGREDVARTEGH